MCATCGCAGDGAVLRLVPDAAAEPAHDHGAGHAHGQDGHGHHEHGHHEHENDGQIRPAAERTVAIGRKILAKNDDIAAGTRQWLADRGVSMLNLMSSPGAGKTTLLERTSRDLAGQLSICVIEGDQETTLDARRIRAAGCEVVQINTGAGCHLDAQMVRSGLAALDPPAGSLVIVENVGNLVCPALFDLGESARVVLASVTEGADKPMKYPTMFTVADLVLIGKIDLLPYVDFDTGRYAGDVRRLSPRAALMELSATAGTGLADWYGWLLRRRPPARG